MPRQTQADKRRLALAKKLWPDGLHWGGPSERGYCCVPRLLPFLMLIASDKRVVGALDCRSALVELLCRDHGQGVIEIGNEEEHAFLAGYAGERAVRTWRERVKMLRDAGIIRIAPKGARELGFVQLVHPCDVVATHRATLDAGFVEHFDQRAIEVGAVRADGTPALAGSDAVGPQSQRLEEPARIKPKPVRRGVRLVRVRGVQK